MSNMMAMIGGTSPMAINHVVMTRSSSFPKPSFLSLRLSQVKPSRLCLTSSQAQANDGKEIEDKYRGAAEKTKEATEDAANLASEKVEEAKEKAKRGMEKTTDTAEGAWKTTTDAASDIKDTVAGAADDVVKDAKKTMKAN